jgi:hypothetical protein
MLSDDDEDGGTLPDGRESDDRSAKSENEPADSASPPSWSTNPESDMRDMPPDPTQPRRPVPIPLTDVVLDAQERDILFALIGSQSLTVPIIAGHAQLDPGIAEHRITNLCAMGAIERMPATTDRYFRITQLGLALMKIKGFIT